MMIDITDLQALEQSDGNRRLRAIIEEVVSQTATRNTDLVTSTVLRRVREEGHSFVIMADGRRQTATEDEIQSRLGEYVQAVLAPQPREAIPPEEFVVGEEGEANAYESFDWLEGVENPDVLEEMVMIDEDYLMDVGAADDLVDQEDDIIDEQPIEDDAMMEGADAFLEGDLEVLGALLDESLSDEEFQLLLHD